MAARRVSHKEIAESLKKARSVAIFGHVLPDSDCYGSMFGIKFALESIGKEAYVYTVKETPEHLDFLNNYGSLKTEEETKEADIVLIFDASQLNRVEVGDVLRKYKAKGVSVYVVDHHMPGDISEFADYIWQDQDFSSTSEMALGILKEIGVKIKKDVATFLLAGIEGDTGSFQYQNTSVDSLGAAAYLMSRGARFQSVVENTFNSKKDLGIMKLYGLALERLVYNKKYKTVATYLTREDIKKYGLENVSGSEIIGYLNIIKGVKMVVMVTEMDEETVKVSLRTLDRDVDVQQLASYVGGGGHVKASGFTTKGKITNIDGKIKITC